MKTIAAIYEQGVFRPLTPVELAEHTLVELQITVLNTTLVAGSIRQHSDAEIREHPLLAFVGLGDSDEVDLSERTEEILLTETHPVYGWSKSQSNIPK